MMMLMEEKMTKKRGEKSKFSITCSLLSQYLKEKGSLAAINGLEMAPAVTPLHLQPKEKLKTPTTLNLLPGVDASADQDMDISKPVELFAHRDGLMEESNLMPPPPPNKEAAEKSPPLTIFYDGKVMVFSGIPADKAEGLMKMANKESAHQKLRFAATNNSPPSSSSAINGAEELPANGSPKATASDMPIARRNSLHRFLEKRKGRVTTKLPYYIPIKSPVLALAKTEGSTSCWLGLGQ